MLLKGVVVSLVGVSMVWGATTAQPRSPAARLGHVPKATVLNAALNSSVGDVNGDGQRDVLVSDCSTNERAGSVYVLFGPFDQERVDTGDLGNRGFVINGAETDDFACFPADAG